MENISEYYYNLLGKSTNPGVDLAKMYGAIFDIKPERKHFMMFNKLIKVYDRFTIFSAILTVSEMENVDHNKYLYPLFSSIAKKRFEKSTGMANIESMESAEKRIKSLERKIKNLEKIELIIPEDIND